MYITRATTLKTPLSSRTVSEKSSAVTTTTPRHQDTPCTQSPPTFSDEVAPKSWQQRRCRLRGTVLTVTCFCTARLSGLRSQRFGSGSGLTCYIRVLQTLCSKPANFTLNIETSRLHSTFGNPPVTELGDNRNKMKALSDIAITLSQL